MPGATAVVGETALATVSWSTTFTLATASWLMMLASVAVTVPWAMVLVNDCGVPGVCSVPVYGTVIVQLEAAAIAPPVSLMPRLPAVATTAPPQVVVGTPTFRPNPGLPTPSIGLSVKGFPASSVIACVGLALVRVMVRVDAWPAATVPGAKALVTLSADWTDSDAVASVVGTRPRRFAKSVARLMVLTRALLNAPLVVVPIRSTRIVQVPPPATVPPTAVTVVAPAVGEKAGEMPAPVHTALAFGAAATSRPVGRMSRMANAGESPTPFNGRFTVGLLALLMTMVRVTVWSLFTTVAEENVLDMTGRFRLLTVTD